VFVRDSISDFNTKFTLSWFGTVPKQFGFHD
jgi:hypothetical protein